jgi:hypothetical protein
MDINLHFQEVEHVDLVERQLKEMAYFNWLNAGKPQGRDLEFWLDAEREMFGFTVDEYWEAVGSASGSNGSLKET